jgi:antitoxin component YwqK of YwqJK toxin-antitoxin module
MLGCDKERIEKEYYDNNVVKAVSCYYAGNLSWRKTFYRDGKIESEAKYNNGNIIKKTGYYQSGEKLYEEYYQNNKIHGKAISYYKNEEVIMSVESFVDGKLHGPQHFFYPSGRLFCRSNYEIVYPMTEYSILYGIFDVYSEEGKIIATGIYKNGCPWEGTFTSADNNKVLALQSEPYLLTYRNGNLVETTKLISPVIKPWLISKEKEDVFINELKEHMSEKCFSKIRLSKGQIPQGLKFKIKSVAIENSELLISVNYIGGQRQHKFTLFWDGTYTGFSNKSVSFQLVDETSEDKNHDYAVTPLRFKIIDFKAPVKFIIKNNYGDAYSIEYKIQ